jgi:hypothetical protein
VGVAKDAVKVCQSVPVGAVGGALRVDLRPKHGTPYVAAAIMWLNQDDGGTSPPAPRNPQRRPTARTQIIVPGVTATPQIDMTKKYLMHRGEDGEHARFQEHAPCRLQARNRRCDPETPEVLGFSIRGEKEPRWAALIGHSAPWHARFPWSPKANVDAIAALVYAVLTH